MFACNVCVVPCRLQFACSLTYGLTELDLSNNTGVTGELPAEMALLPQLQVVKMMQTNASCAGINKPYVSSISTQPIPTSHTFSQ